MRPGKSKRFVSQLLYEALISFPGFDGLGAQELIIFSSKFEKWFSLYKLGARKQLELERLNKKMDAKSSYYYNNTNALLLSLRYS